MKRYISAATLFFVFSLKSFAAGIPVVDVAGLAQMVQDGLVRAQEFQKTIGEARNRLNQMKQTAQHYKSMVEGHYSFETIINDPNLNQFFELDGVKDIYDSVGDIASMRDEYGLYSDNPSVQRRYDSQLKTLRFQEELHEQFLSRSERMNSLLSQFNAANTPAKKADLGNAIEYEQMQLANEQNMMVAMNSMLEQQRKIQAQADNVVIKEQVFGDGIPIN